MEAELEQPIPEPPEDETRFLHRLRDISIKRKLLLLTMVTSITALLIAGVVLLFNDLALFRQSVVERATLQAEAFARHAANNLYFGDDLSSWNDILRSETDDRIIAVVVFDNSRRPAADYARDSKEDADAQLAYSEIGHVIDREYVTVTVPVYRQGGDENEDLDTDAEVVGRLTLRSDLSDIGDRIASYLLIAGSAIALAFALTVVFTAQVHRVILRPLVELAAAARQVAFKKDYSVRATKQGNDEIGRTVDGFNEMLAQIQRRDAQLLEAQTDLEKRVDARTSELSRINTQLRKQVERRQQAEEEQRKLAFLVQNSNDFIALARLDGQTLFLNGAGREMVEIAEDADISELSLKDFHTRNSMTQYFDEILPTVKEQGMWQGQSELKKFESKTPLPVHRSLFLIRNPKTQEAMCYATVCRDISDQLNLEAQLRQSQKMEAVGQLAAGVAHDFNNILTIIQGNATLLEAAKELDEATHSGVTAISEAVNRAANLTRQLLTFSRKQRLQPKPLDLAVVVSNLAKLLKRALGEPVELQLNLPSDLPLVKRRRGHDRADRDQSGGQCPRRHAPGRPAHRRRGAAGLRADDGALAHRRAAGRVCAPVRFRHGLRHG